MSVFKIVNEKYSKLGDLKNLIRYAVREDHCMEGICGAQGLLLGSPEGMYQQMYDIKGTYYKREGRQAKHFILSFDEEERKFIGLREAEWIGYEVAAFFWKWQVVFGVHTNTENLHIHFVLNTVSYEDGLKYNVSLPELQVLREKVEMLVEQFYYSKHRTLFTAVPSVEGTIEGMISSGPALFPCQI